MPNCWHLTIALATVSTLFISETASSQLSTVSSNYHLVSGSNTDQLVCYMQTADGRTINLDSLCIKKRSNQSQIVISDMTHKDNSLIGRVVNRSSKTIYNTRVNYEVIDENDRVIDRGSISTESPTLSPGQTTIFMTFMPNNRNVRTTSVEWNEKE
jgi:hypothetical protein